MMKRTVRVQALSSASATTHATNNSHGGRAIEDDQRRNEDARHRVNEETRVVARIASPGLLGAHPAGDDAFSLDAHHASQHRMRAITTGTTPSAHKASHPPIDQQMPISIDMTAPPENMMT
jgi:hypothetical protein